MLKAVYAPYRLWFKFLAKTSRATMNYKDTYFIKIWDDSDHNVFGIGECALFRGLGCDDCPDYEAVLDNVCKNINNIDIDSLRKFPSIVFGVETALSDLRSGGIRKPFPSEWTDGNGSITINGLVWMGTAEDMKRRVQEKIGQGFRCIKFKIGGIDFESEVELIKNIRVAFSPDVLEIRLDANGAFAPDIALDRLEILSSYSIHSIEQPIRPGQRDDMQRICKESPIPIALDEELIGFDPVKAKDLLEYERPDYIILKPSLCGGFSGAQKWITAAESLSIGWWITSALESNIGLNAIAQWTYRHNVTIPQGLGTGQLYINNIDSPLVQSGESLIYDNTRIWNLPDLDWNGKN